MTQPDLFDPSQVDKFNQWVHTPAGREIANHFIRLAYYGSKGIVERLRWHYTLKYAKIGSGEWKINNNWTAHLARFAENREPTLRGFFEKRRMAL